MHSGSKKSPATTSHSSGAKQNARRRHESWKASKYGFLLANRKLRFVMHWRYSSEALLIWLLWWTLQNTRRLCSKLWKQPEEKDLLQRHECCVGGQCWNQSSDITDLVAVKAINKLINDFAPWKTRKTTTTTTSTTTTKKEKKTPPKQKQKTHTHKY